MNGRKIVLAGGTGFIGRYLKKRFSESGYEVLIISRQKEGLSWQHSEAIITAVNGADVLINLAGKSVDCRYNEKNKAAILNSRISTTRLLGEAVLQCSRPPKLWINSSTATIYRHAQDRPMTEEEGEIGSGFSVEVAKEWEKAFFDFALPVTRQVALRIAIVLGKEGGVMVPFKNLVRFGLGGQQGSGRQMFSWLHIEDLFGIISFIQAHDSMAGVYNCSAPHPVSNKILMQTLRQTMGMKFGLPSPAFLLKIGAVIIRTETELILKSRWVVPQRLLEAGYTFRYATLSTALKNILDQERRR